MQSNSKEDFSDRGWYLEPLSGFLDLMTQNWEADRQAYWEDKGGPEGVKNGKVAFEKIKMLSDGLFESSQNIGDDTYLVGVAKDIGAIACMFEEKDMLVQYLAEQLELHLVSGFLPRIENGAIKLISLFRVLSYLESFTLNKSVLDFLRLVIRNYVWGFDTECVILCRSAMEMAIRERISDEMCEKHLGNRRGQYTLVDRIAVAGKENLLSDKEVKVAHSIRERGNTALHKDPGVTKDIIGTIKMTTVLIGTMTRDL